MGLFGRNRRRQNRWVESDGAVPADTRPVSQQGDGPGDSPAGRVSGVPRRLGRGAAAVGTLAAGVMTLSRLVLLLATLIAVLIGLAILLRDVDANAGNTVVKGIHDGANFFAGAFTGLASFHGHPKRAITVDWGIAALVYLAAGVVVAAVVRRFGRSGLAWERNHGAGVTT